MQEDDEEGRLANLRLLGKMSQSDSATVADFDQISEEK